MGDIRHLESMERVLKCPICLSLFNSAISLSCTHIFCNECILKAMKMNATCPLCKIPYHRTEIGNAPYMDRLVSIYNDMEDAFGVNLFLSQNNPPPPATYEEKHVRDVFIKKISDMDSYESLISEPPHISNWFSSYVYESPMMDTSNGFEFSDLGESKCLRFVCKISEPTDVIDDSDIDEETSSPKTKSMKVAGGGTTAKRFKVDS